MSVLTKTIHPRDLEWGTQVGVLAYEKDGVSTMLIDYTTPDSSFITKTRKMKKISTSYPYSTIVAVDNVNKSKIIELLNYIIHDSTLDKVELRFYDIDREAKINPSLILKKKEIYRSTLKGYRTRAISKKHTPTIKVDVEKMF